MYVAPSFRGRGIGARLLTSLEAEAKRLQLLRIVLETGDRQPEALAVYRRAGYAVIPAFGEYIGTPRSVCMEKRLRSACGWSNGSSFGGGSSTSRRRGRGIV